MNFFGHALAAAAVRLEKGFVLGAMLPDLASMAGLRLLGAEEPVLAAGISFHHACDARFHAEPSFQRACLDATHTLRAAGVRRGPARGAAHAGLELLLDGFWARSRGVPSLYRAALEEAPAAVAALRWRGGEGGMQLTRTCGRILRSQLPQAYAEPDFAVARLVRLLERRPRLALVPDEVAAVRRWARTAKLASLAAATLPSPVGHGSQVRAS
jgi:hypothetical protein